MKRYVCWGTFRPAPWRGGHTCGRAYEELREAGYEQEVVRSYGLTGVPLVNRTDGRRRAKELTGKETVPVLELDDGTAISESDRIVAWARSHPAARIA